MTDLTPDHPAVEAAVKGWFGTATGSDEGDMCAALNAALPHLTSATEDNLARLRNTEAGRALLVEGWHDGYDDGYDTGYCAGKREHHTAPDTDHECIRTSLNGDNA